MIRVRVIGGLGNQLFQYATARALVEKLNTTLKIDVSSFNSYKTHPLRLHKFKCFGQFIEEKSLLKRWIKWLLRRIVYYKSCYVEKSLSYDDKLLNLKDGSCLSGFFQSEKYFASIRSQLLQELSLVDELTVEGAGLSQSIQEGNSIAVHVRRGNYVVDSTVNKVHGSCSEDYFKRALRLLKSEGALSDGSHLYIFSDDIPWCKENLFFDYPVTFVEGDPECPEVDLVLMSQCKHQIISNSTFSWWGAWLNTNEDKFIIAPKVWFRTSELDSEDIIPDKWLRI